ncbi:MAG: glycosyltransferase family 39 protein [Planctomycetota bacterium]|nr:glycosyltransferase family 39 protein [Planctomycetota bacterium]
MHVGLLAGVCLVLFLLNAHSLPLADPEEARCGLIVRDMLEHGHWLVPHLRRQPYLDKPAPYFWLAAAAVRLTGSEEFGGRLISALAGLAAVLVARAFARRVFASDAAGLVAGLVLATSGEFLFLARWYRMDMPFAAAAWGALWWFWRREEARLAGGPAGKVRAWVGFYLLAALASLFKGPAGLLLPALVVAAYFLLARQGRRILEFFSLPGLGAYLLLAAPWYVAATWNQPGFAQEFFLRQNLQRFTGSGGLGHNWPGVLYLPIVLAGTLPWTLYLPGAFLRTFPLRWRRRNDRPAFLFLWLAALVPLAFFALSGTKLPAYVLPVFAPLAVLVGGMLGTWAVSRQPDRLMSAGAVALLISVAALPAAPLAMELWLRTAGPWLGVPFAISLTAAAAMWWALKRNRRAVLAGWAGAAVVGVYLYLILHSTGPAYERMSLKPLALAPGEGQLRASRVSFWPDSNLSFLFYAGMEDAQAFRSVRRGGLAALVQWFQAEGPAYCLVAGADHVAQLRQACPAPLWALGHRGRFWLISNRAPKP